MDEKYGEKSVIPEHLFRHLIILSIDDTMVEKHGEHFENRELPFENTLKWAISTALFNKSSSTDRSWISASCFNCPIIWSLFILYHSVCNDKKNNTRQICASMGNDRAYQMPAFFIRPDPDKTGKKRKADIIPVKHGKHQIKEQERRCFSQHFPDKVFAKLRK